MSWAVQFWQHAVGELGIPASGSLLAVCWPHLGLFHTVLCSLELVQAFLCGGRILRNTENIYHQFTTLAKRSFCSYLRGRELFPSLNALHKESEKMHYQGLIVGKREKVSVCLPLSHQRLQGWLQSRLSLELNFIILLC